MRNHRNITETYTHVSSVTGYTLPFSELLSSAVSPGTLSLSLNFFPQLCESLQHNFKPYGVALESVLKFNCDIVTLSSINCSYKKCLPLLAFVTILPVTCSIDKGYKQVKHVCIYTVMHCLVSLIPRSTFCNTRCILPHELYPTKQQRCLYPLFRMHAQ